MVADDSMGGMDLTDKALIVGASARLTRLVVTDDLGQWWVKDPVDELMDHYHATHDWQREEPWWWKYRSGLDCQHCFGFHASWVVLLSYLLARRSPRSYRLWRFVAGALTVNYITAHVEAYLTDTETDDEQE